MQTSTDIGLVFKARWVLPISGPAIENGGLYVKGSKIERVLDIDQLPQLEAELPNVDFVDFGQAVICPGLINLHTHLDYSWLRHFDCYSDFLDWIGGLVGSSWQWTKEQWCQSALCGAKQVALSGVTCVADSSYSGAAALALADLGLKGVVGLELFGVLEEKADSQFEQWEKNYRHFLDQASPRLKASLAADQIQITIAPHTPYSVCPRLMRLAKDWADAKALRLLTHLAESDMECAWIGSYHQGLQDFLSKATQAETGGKIPELPWRGKGLSPVQHLAQHKLLSDNVLAAHLIKLSEADISVLQENQVNAALCPRSNSRLRNGIAPFSALLKAGLNIGFGTDSLASVDDLDLLAEARFALNLQRAIDSRFSMRAEQALYLLTLGAAKALGLSDRIGSLAAGKAADIAVFSLDGLEEPARRLPYESVVFGGGRLEALFVDGKELVAKGRLKAEFDQGSAITTFA